MRYRDTELKLQEIDRWLIEKRGHGMGQSRLGTYLRTIKSAIEGIPKWQTDPKSYVPEFGGKTLYSLVELHEIFNIYDVAKEAKNNYLLDQFVELVGGPENAGAESPDGGSGRPRNTQYELSVACQLIRAGFPFVHPDIEDVRTTFFGKDLFIECKRPQSLDTVSKNIDKAISQLRKRFSSNTSLGLVAISLNKALIAHDRYVSCETARPAQDAVADLVQDVSKKINLKSFPPQCIGILFEVVFPGTVRSQGGLCVIPAQTMTYNGLCSPKIRQETELFYKVLGETAMKYADMVPEGPGSM